MLIVCFKMIEQGNTEVHLDGCNFEVNSAGMAGGAVWGMVRF